MYRWQSLCKDFPEGNLCTGIICLACRTIQVICCIMFDGCRVVNLPAANFIYFLGGLHFDIRNLCYRLRLFSRYVGPSIAHRQVCNFPFSLLSPLLSSPPLRSPPPTATGLPTSATTVLFSAARAFRMRPPPVSAHSSISLVLQWRGSLGKLFFSNVLLSQTSSSQSVCCTDNSFSECLFIFGNTLYNVDFQMVLLRWDALPSTSISKH